MTLAEELESLLRGKGGSRREEDQEIEERSSRPSHRLARRPGPRRRSRRLFRQDDAADALSAPLDAVVARPLAILLATENVVRYPYPWLSTLQVTLQVTVDIVRFDVDAAG